MTEAIFKRIGDDRYLATEAALGPWSQEALHGSPSTMLLAREIERFPSDVEMLVTRLTVELLRPVGRTPITVRSRMVRPGRKVQLLEASLWNDDQELARATGLRLRRGEAEVPETSDALPVPAPDGLEAWTRAWRSDPAYHVLGVEIRTLNDSGPRPSPGWAWFRLKLPLLPDEEPTPLIRVCAAADFPNGISFVVDPRKISFVNADLSVYLHRLPVDEWVLVAARTWLESTASGFAEGALYDRRGRIGRSLQSLLVERRS